VLETDAWNGSDDQASELAIRHPAWATASDIRSHEAPAPIARRVGPWTAAVVAGLVAGLGLGYVIWGPDPATPVPAAVVPTEGAAAASEPDPSPPAAAPAAAPSAQVPTANPGAAAGASPRPAAAEPAQASGSLLIRSVPSGATVFVDDERRGVTPLTLQRVAFGTRRVRIQRDGFSAQERQVSLTRDRPSRSLDVRLTRAASAPAAAPPTSARPAAKTGTIRVESRPAGATVLLNGRPVGTTPTTIEDLAPGSYTVQMQLAGFQPIRTTVRVVAGETVRAAASLTGVQEQP
jgi:hypothetical protein